MRKLLFGWMMLPLLAAGSMAAKTTPASFTADYLGVKAVKQKLAENGLEVLGTHAVAGSNAYTVVVYTAPILKKAAQQPRRGFAAVQRILVDANARQLVVNNPEYYLRAFLQKDYREGMAQPLVQALEKALGKLAPTEDELKTKKLEKYHFMIGMPHYGDFVRVAKGDTAALCKKLEANAKGRIVFKLDLNGDGSSVLYGVALPKEIEQFNEKLGTMGSSQLLPYTVLVENGEADILHAKYYLALSFPRLSMTEFMRIMSIPNDIRDAFKADFQ